MGSCRFAAWPAGAGSGLGPACPLAGRAPGQHRPSPCARGPAGGHPQAERQPGGCDLYRQGQGRKPGSPPDQGRLHGLGRQAPQTLKNFVAETHLPLTLGILLDTSGSQQRVLSLEQDVGSQFLERVLKQKDEAFLLSFDVDVDLLQDYTNSPRLLARAMSKAEINTAGGNGAAGIPGAGGGTIPTMGKPKGTLLYDAVYLAATRKDEPGDGPQGDDSADRRRGRGQPHQDQRGDCRGRKIQRHCLHDSDRRPGLLWGIRLQRLLLP
jgi:hypothetical protein